MRRMAGLAWPVAAAALLALGGLLAVNALRGPATTTRAEQAQALAAELRCPDCQGLSVADSPTRAAGDIRREIATMLDEGRTPNEVREHFVARYGEWILLAPPRPLLVVLPLLALVGGVGLLVLWLRPSRRGVEPDPSPEPRSAATEPELRRIREEAERLDA